MADVCKESELLPLLSSMLEEPEVLAEVTSAVLGLVGALANSSEYLLLRGSVRAGQKPVTFPPLL